MLALKAGASETYGDRRRDSLIPEIPRGMQPGLLSSSHCGRWIGAHQWLAELISVLNCSTLLWLLNVRESAGLKCSLQVYCWLCWCMIRDSLTFLQTSTHQSQNTATLTGMLRYSQASMFNSRSLLNKNTMDQSLFQQWFKRRLLRSAYEVVAKKVVGRGDFSENIPSAG